MAMIRFICCFCQAPFDIDDWRQGSVVRCPSCRRELTVPAPVVARTDDVQPSQAVGGGMPFGAAAKPSLGGRGLQFFMRLPLTAQLLAVGSMCSTAGALFGSGCTAICRYSAEAYQNVATRAERAERDLAVLKERQKEVRPDTAKATALTPKSTPHKPQPAKPVQLVAEPIRTPLNGDVAITIEVTELPKGRVRLCGTTNLPTDTVLMLSVEEKAQGGFNGQSKCSVAADGSFNSEAFGPPNGLKDGVYVADVVMPIPRVQSESVRQAIGVNGENLSGPLVENGPFGVTVSAKKEFTIGGERAAQAQQERVNDRIQQYREWQNKVVALHSRLELARGSSDPVKWAQFARTFRKDFESDQAQLMKVESMSARFTIGDALTAVIRMFHATAFHEPEDYDEASADYTTSLNELEKFIRKSGLRYKFRVTSCQ